MRVCDTVEERQASLSLLLHSLTALYVRMVYIALNQLLQNPKGPGLAAAASSPPDSSAPVHVMVPFT